MSILLILILISMVVAGSFLAAFLWAVKSGQYSDTYSPAVRILFDEKQRSINNLPSDDQRPHPTPTSQFPDTNSGL